MNKNFTIERGGETREIVIRQLPHDEQYGVGSRIKWGSGKMWAVTGVVAPPLPSFQVGDRVKAVATHDRPEVPGLVVDSVTLHGGQHGVSFYYRLNCYVVDLGDCLARFPRTKISEVTQVEAAERFFEHEGEDDLERARR